MEEKPRQETKEIKETKETEETEEKQYIKIIEKVLTQGVWENGRNGRTKMIFGESMRFSLTNGKIPILTTKQTAWKSCLKELLWFIRGQTDNWVLQKQGVHIWDGNASREFLDSRGLKEYPEGLLGPIYGFQWRHFDGDYAYDLDGSQKKSPNIEVGVDQLQYIIRALQNPQERNSRRLVLTAWNPKQLDKMALPPCHILSHYQVIHDKLNCIVYARSQDLPLGTPFNIASYAFLMHLLAKHCDLIPGELILFMGNCHIYEEHIEPIKKILIREPFEFPTLEIKVKRENIEDYQIEDFIISNYIYHEKIEMIMKV